MSNGLKFSRILQALSRQTVTDVGGRLAETLGPAPDAEAASQRLDEVAEAEVLLRVQAVPVIPSRLDVDDLFARATRGAPLDGTELAVLRRLATASRTARRAAQLWPPEIRRLRRLTQAMPDLDLLASLLADAVDDDGNILDGASHDLGRLRQEVLTLGARMRRRIEAMVKETDAAGLLQDDYYTLRDDRYVLPVRATEKRTLGGIIHGASQTGATVYVEPQELVEANNALALAAEAVRREERRILAELTALCAEHADDFQSLAQLLGLLDLRTAGARLAVQLAAHRPQLAAGGGIAAPTLRHPVLVLDGVQVVPSDIALQPPGRWLVISGPNGGGKTVVLTALGLLVEMARHGLFVCASADTVVPWFDRVEVVLGDGQDIERGLSTFEGHLRWVADALQRAARPGNSLVLLDELASGTEPMAGSALATAVLEHAIVSAPQAWGAITTHFEALKLMALRDHTCVNAALELDARTLTPTYRVRMGHVGTSNPLALATRLGLPPSIVDRAQQLLGTGGSEVATLLERLELERAGWEQKTAAVEHERKQLEHSRTLLEDQRRMEQKAADRRIEKAAEQALGELRQAAIDLDSARAALVTADRKRIEEAHKAVAARQVVVEHAQQAAKARLHGKVEPEAAEKKPFSLSASRPGDTAWHVGLQRVVQILEISPRGDRCKVRAGSLELWAQPEDLLRPAAAELTKHRLDSKPGRQQGVVQTALKDSTAQPTSLEEGAALLRAPDLTVDLRGMRVDEALNAVDRHLDRLVLSGRPGACIVHGLGTGALRDSVRAHLSRHTQVERLRSGDRGEGGDGATLVWLRQ